MTREERPIHQEEIDKVETAKNELQKYLCDDLAYLIADNFISEKFKALKEKLKYFKSRHEYEGNIYCNCVYDWKENIKKLGFKWNPKYKKWYIPIGELTPEVYGRTLKFRFCNYTTAGPLYYFYVNYESTENMKTYVKETIEKAKETEINEKPIKQAKKKTEINGKPTQAIKRNTKPDYTEYAF